MHRKISSAKWRPFCPGGDELKRLLYDPVISSAKYYLSYTFNLIDDTWKVCFFPRHSNKMLPVFTITVVWRPVWAIFKLLRKTRSDILYCSLLPSQFSDCSQQNKDISIHAKVKLYDLGDSLIGKASGQNIAIYWLFKPHKFIHTLLSTGKLYLYLLSADTSSILPKQKNVFYGVWCIGSLLWGPRWHDDVIKRKHFPR